MTTPPSTNSTSFNCPHCRTLAQQFWFGARASSYDKDNHPNVWNAAEVDARLTEFAETGKIEKTALEAARLRLHKLATGEVIFADERSNNYDANVDNVWFSRCYACNRISVWIYDRLVHPALVDGPIPNPDMPLDVQADYLEAARIAAHSPRGAAALLRLALQRLMPHLGQKGKDLNDDIAGLVANGLSVLIQRSLDVVRVIGNNAVHPGQIDIRDNPETVSTLFRLLNVIVDMMISQPLHIAAAYGGLPEGARKQIETRDKKDN